MTAAPSRRQALRLLGGGGGLLALAACTTKASHPRPRSAVTGTDAVAAPTSRSASVASSGASAAVDPSASAKPTLAALSGRLSRPLLRPGSSAFGTAATLYNPRFDVQRAPAAIAPCTTAADVAECVRFAADTAVPLSLRGGGHGYGGWAAGAATGGRGLVIDTRAIRGVQIAPDRRTARIGAGALLVDVYAALGAVGLGIPGGSCPTVGITGLALGGGIGVLTRAFGLTCDVLAAVEIVTSDGILRTVDANHDPDLFWALRGGGGGSFGAVTALTVRLQPITTLQTYYLEFDFGRAGDVVAAWQQWLPQRPASVWSTCKLLGEADGSAKAVVAGTVTAGTDPAPQLAALIAAIGPPTANYVSSLSYVGAMLAEAGCAGQSPDECRSEALQPPKRQPFAATSSIVQTALPAAAVATAVQQVRAATTIPGVVQAGVSFDGLGGAVAAIGAADTAFAYRAALASVQYTATWAAGAPAGPSAAAPFDAYVRGFRAALRPWLGDAAYVNYADPSIADFANAYWGTNYSRLRRVKTQYDPHELFTFPQAVRPV